MPRVLIISFHFSPLEIIASERAKNMVNFLPESGWAVDLLTHDWQIINGVWDPGATGTEKIEVTSNGARVIRIGAGSQHRNYQNTIKNSFSRKLHILRNWRNGWLDYRAVCRDGYESMSEWMNKNVHHQYDLILGIYSPHSHLKLLSEWSKKSSIPVHFDFRDLWDNGLASGKSSSGMPFIQQYFIKKHWQRWLHCASGLSSVSSGLTKYLEQTYKKPSFTLYTGFDPKDFPLRSEDADDFFHIVHAGTIYNNQKIEILLQGISLFLQAHPDEKIQVHFPGLIRPGETSGDHSYLSNAEKFVRTIITDPRVYISNRIPLMAARQMMVDASVLLKPSFPDNPGIVGGKMFEYLGAARFIISAPDDKGSINEIIKTSQSGEIANDPQGVCTVLNRCFAEWKTRGTVACPGQSEHLKIYSASQQMKAFGDWLSSNLP
jgi:glycosyltransferase involved in cell wall biosynthesis